MVFFNFEIFFISFGIIFLAELGDKTQITVITLAAKEKSPFKIGLATSIGISLVVIIGIIIGYFLNIFIPDFFIKIIGISIFLAFGVISLIKIKLENDESEEKSEEKVDNSKIKIANVFIFALLSIFIMEFGDKTQLMTISLTANYILPLEVGLGACLALSSLCFMGAYLGDFISKKIPKKWIDFIGSIVFIVIGIIMLIELILSL